MAGNMPSPLLLSDTFCFRILTVWFNLPPDMLVRPAWHEFPCQCVKQSTWMIAEQLSFLVFFSVRSGVERNETCTLLFKTVFEAGKKTLKAKARRQAASTYLIGIGLKTLGTILTSNLILPFLPFRVVFFSSVFVTRSRVLLPFPCLLASFLCRLLRHLIVTGVEAKQRLKKLCLTGSSTQEKPHAHRHPGVSVLGQKQSVPSSVCGCLCVCKCMFLAGEGAHRPL